MHFVSESVSLIHASLHYVALFIQIDVVEGILTFDIEEPMHEFALFVVHIFHRVVQGVQPWSTTCTCLYLRPKEPSFLWSFAKKSHSNRGSFVKGGAGWSSSSFGKSTSMVGNTDSYAEDSGSGHWGVILFPRTQHGVDSPR